MTPDRILIVDDESSMALAMQQVLARHGFEADTAPDGREALSVLAREPYALVITDLRMPGMDGHELAREVRQRCPSSGVVVVTAYGTVESAVSCVRAGAANYLMKPFSPDDLVRAATEALRTRPSRPSNEPEPPSIVAEDPATRAVLDLARRAAEADVTVLLEAESGAGKEVLARLIHRESRRASGPFVAVNCAALPRELLEAELFGHTRGAFTGAHRDRRGYFRAADGGTLLLDEIGEMNPDLQARLLRVLQDRVVQPIGAESATRVDVRVIAATNCNLRQEVAAGRFREDLYYRLRVLPIRIPPLRERPADLEPLASRFARELGGPGAMLTPRALAKLAAHAWPGNVRELQNAVQRAVIMAGKGPIDAGHFELEPAPRDMASAPVGRSLGDAEREAIFRVLEETRGNRIEAARALGISPRTLRHKLKRYRDDGIALPEVRR
jgi:two-component system response regulator FlrC